MTARTPISFGVINYMGEKMQKLFLLVVSLLVLNSGRAMASELPDCWQESGMDVEDGNFILSLETGLMTKAELLDVLDKANGVYIRALSYPNIFDESVFITVSAVDYGVGDNRLTREELKARVNGEITAILAVPGTSAFCNGRVYPAGSGAL
jgi:hypothetical protein